MLTLTCSSAGHVSVSIRAHDGVCRGELWARLGPTVRAKSLRHGPDLAVMQVVFSDVTVNCPPDQLIVRFSFDHA